MMSKKVIVGLLLSFVVAISTQRVSALGLEYGVGAGTNLSCFSSKSDDIKLGSGWGFQAGAFVGLDIALFAITPEFWYSRGVATYDATPIGGQTGNLVVESLDVPVVLSISLFGPLKVKAGPTFSIWSRAKLPDGDTYSNVKASYGYLAGLGLNFSSIGIDVRYNGLFSSSIIPTGVESLTQQDYKIRADSFSIVMTYSF